MGGGAGFDKCGRFLHRLIRRCDDLGVSLGATGVTAVDYISCLPGSFGGSDVCRVSARVTRTVMRSHRSLLPCSSGGSKRLRRLADSLGQATSRTGAKRDHGPLSFG